MMSIEQGAFDDSGKSSPPGTGLIRWVFLAVFALLLAGCGDPPYTNVDNAGLKDLIARGVPVIDIRTAGEWQETGVIPASHRITYFDDSGRVNPRFMERFERLVSDKTKPVALVCRSGNRSSVLGRSLAKDLGYTQVYNLKEGIRDWIRERNPVAR